MDGGGFFGSMARALVDAVTIPPSPRSEIRKAEAEMMRRKEGRPKVTTCIPRLAVPRLILCFLCPLLVKP